MTPRKKGFTIEAQWGKCEVSDQGKGICQLKGRECIWPWKGDPLQQGKVH